MCFAPARLDKSDRTLRSSTDFFLFPLFPNSSPYHHLPLKCRRLLSISPASSRVALVRMLLSRLSATRNTEFPSTPDMGLSTRAGGRDFERFFPSSDGSLSYPQSASMYPNSSSVSPSFPYWSSALVERTPRSTTIPRFLKRLSTAQLTLARAILSRNSPGCVPNAICGTPGTLNLSESFFPQRIYAIYAHICYSTRALCGYMLRLLC
jgi:hypothetical protein